MNIMLGGIVKLTGAALKLDKVHIDRFRDETGTVIQIDHMLGRSLYMVRFRCQDGYMLYDLRAEHIRLLAPPEWWDSEAQAAFYDSQRLDKIYARAKSLSMETIVDGETIVLDNRENTDRWINAGCPDYWPDGDDGNGLTIDSVR